MGATFFPSYSTTRRSTMNDITLSKQFFLILIFIQIFPKTSEKKTGQTVNQTDRQ